jgi:uncharacterized protein
MNTMDDFQQEAQNFIQQVVEGDFAGACRRYDNQMAQVFPEAKLKEAWLQLIGQVGPFQAITNYQAIEKQGYVMVTLTCQFERSPVDIRVSFNESGQVAGLTYHLAAGLTPYHPPVYVDAAAFHEVELTVGSGEWALPATLSLPDGSGPCPAVVLVHGSGPQDRDETIGPNKPFRDLAWGLASRGIAVLRYDKRTMALADRYTPELIARVTVQDEVVDDALSAVRLLRQTPGIDPLRIYVLGHSLGATVAPRIGQQDPSIAGLIVMAGITRPLEDVILDQYTYLYGLSGAMTDEQKAELKELSVKVARVKDPNLSNQVPAKDLPLGVNPAYWLDLRGYQPAEVAKSLAMRIFVLQGERDYQVTVAGDYPAWQKALGEKSSATLKLYPKLFHLFMTGEGPSTPQEYMVEGHIDEEVIQDIAEWIRN